MIKWIAGLFSPVNDVLKTIDVSGNDRRKIENAFQEMQASMYTQVVELEKAKLDAHAKIIQAESQSASWIGRNWRPSVSLTLVGLCIISEFGFITTTERLWELTMILVAGHGASRGFEKIASAVTLKK